MKPSSKQPSKPALKLPFFQIDAFAKKAFEGNPAAVIPLEQWLDDELMQKIAEENNLSETVFFIEDSSDKSDYEIRWFTPKLEVKLCGHATLATAHLLFSEKPGTYSFANNTIRFSSRSGILQVVKRDSRLTLDFPSAKTELLDDQRDIANTIYQALGVKAIDFVKSEDLLVVLDRSVDLGSLKPDMFLLKTLPYRGVLVTNQSNDADYDFYARFFAPNVGINEDPATGSAYTLLAPYWEGVLNKSSFNARQLSKRGADIDCEVKGDRVHISGSAVSVIEGNFYL